MTGQGNGGGAEAGAGASRYAATREVRFAVVMYGGISLAIYINGVAQELFRLVQATAPEAGGEPVRLRLADDRLSPSAQVYRRLARRLHGDDDGSTVRTRFVVDILSGTSAGGINGVLLAKALANGRDFGAASARIWLAVADVAELLLSGKGRQRALLDGDRLYREARAALAELGPGAGAGRDGRAGDDGGDDLHAAAYVEQLDLAVTATDRRGLDTPVELRRGAEVAERQHRTVFAFSHGSEATSGERHSDLGADCDRMLAFAARATSSFPVAFEPISLDALPPHDERVPQRGPRPWLRDHERARLTPEQVLFADGGFLDNKPFTLATRALRRRRADLPVTRLLLYVEPDPADPGRTAAEEPAPDRGVVANALAAFTLPRAEPIRQDVVELSERNARIDLLRRAERDAIDLPGELSAAARESYLRLRRVTTGGRLAEVAAELGDWEPDGSRQRAAAADLCEAIGADLLPDVDLAFQRRRLSFLDDRLDELVRAPGDDRPLLAVKRALNEAFAPLRAAQRLPSAADRDALLAAHPGWAEPFEAVVAAARAEPFDPGRYAATVAAFLGEPLRQTDAAITAALAAAKLPALVELDGRFEAIDGVVLPLAHPDLGELNAVALHRVSPLDATALSDLGNAKLAGVRLHHFGAFLSRRFRWNDLLWGRLDAVEAIAAALLPGAENDAARGRFRVEAQAAIVREAVIDDRTEDSAALRAEIGQELRLRGGAASDDDALLAAFGAVARVPDQLGDEEQKALRRRVAPAVRRLLWVEGRSALGRALERLRRRGRRRLGRC